MSCMARKAGLSFKCLIDSVLAFTVFSITSAKRTMGCCGWLRCGGCVLCFWWVSSVGFGGWVLWFVGDGFCGFGGVGYSVGISFAFDGDVS